MYKSILGFNTEREEAEIAVLRKKIAILDRAISRLRERLYILVDIVHIVKQNKGEAL